MGLPLTWVTLSLVQLFWAHGNIHERVDPFKICGDDLLAVWTTN